MLERKAFLNEQQKAELKINEEMDRRAGVLADFLKTDKSEIDGGLDHGETISDRIYFDHEGGEWLVLADDEATATAEAYISQSLWAFNADFMHEQTGIPEAVFTALIDSGICEGANEAVEALIKHTCGMDAFHKAAIKADGRGRYVATYDFEEHKHKGLFLYQLN